MITPDNCEWDVYCEDVQMVLNNTINDSTGESPHYLLYGYCKRLPVSLIDEARPPIKVYNYDDYISQRIRKYHQTILNVRKMISKNQTKWEKYYKSDEKKDIKVGNEVFVKKFVPEGPNVKLSPKFEGPYRVLEVLRNNKYKVIDNKCKERIVHYNHLKIPLQENEGNANLGSDDGATVLSRLRPRR